MSEEKYVFKISEEAIRLSKLSDVEAVAEIIEQKKEISQLKAELEKLKSSQAQADKGEVDKLELLNPSKCHICGKPYGKTNCNYKGIELWQACGCQPENTVYFINKDKLQFMDEPQQVESKEFKEQE